MPSVHGFKISAIIKINNMEANEKARELAASKNRNTKIMIQASELRIGNWFYFGEMIGQCNTDSFKDTSVFDPIPITPEILEKAGFMKVNYAWMLRDDFTSGRSPAMGNIFSIWDELEIYSYNGDSLSPEIKYLHQLQNLYHALVGEELTINF